VADERATSKDFPCNCLPQGYPIENPNRLASSIVASVRSVGLKDLLNVNYHSIVDSMRIFLRLYAGDLVLRSLKVYDSQSGTNDKPVHAGYFS
jgi:hypothetical protein